MLRERNPHLRNYRLQLRVCCAYGGFRTSSPLTYSIPVDPISPPSENATATAAYGGGGGYRTHVLHTF